MSDFSKEAEAVKEIVNLAKSGIEIEALPNGKTGVLVPDGFKFVQIGEDHPLPEMICENQIFTETHSFIRYVNRFKDESTQIFADVDELQIGATIDYHTKEGAPQHALHKARLAIPQSKEWEIWTGIDGKLIEQKTFAEFIEENSIDIIEPDGATLLELVSHLKAKKDVEFESGKNLHNGESQLIYREKIEGRGKGEMPIPTKITLNIPVFFNGDIVNIEAFLRWRIQEGRLLFKIDLHRLENIRMHAFENIILQVEKETDIQPYHGKI